MPKFTLIHCRSTLWKWGKKGEESGASNTPDQLSGPVQCWSRKNPSSSGLKDAHKGCQLTGLRRTPRYTLYARDLLFRRSSVPDQYSGTQGNLVIHSMLLHSSARSFNQDLPRWCLGSGLHKPPEKYQKSRGSKEADLILVWAEIHISSYDCCAHPQCTQLAGRLPHCHLSCREKSLHPEVFFQDLSHMWKMLDVDRLVSRFINKLGKYVSRFWDLLSLHSGCSGDSIGDSIGLVLPYLHRLRLREFWWFSSHQIVAPGRLSVGPIGSCESSATWTSLPPCLLVVGFIVLSVEGQS